jgi:hypothetical protein
MTFLGRSRFRDRLRSVGGVEAFPLDGFSPTFAFSTRRLFTTFTTALLRIRSSVGAFNEVDVFPDSSGWISLTSAVSPTTWGATLGAFATNAGGLNSTGNATVRTWYNQGTVSSAGDVGNATAGNQPILMESGAFSANTTIGTANRPALYLIRGFAPTLVTSTTRATSEVVNGSVQSTIMAVSQLLEAGQILLPFGFGTPAVPGRWAIFSGADTTRRGDFGDDATFGGRLNATAPTALDAEYAVYRRNGTFAEIRRNGADLANVNTLTTTISVAQLVRVPDNAVSCNSKTAEVIVFPAYPTITSIESSQASGFGI